MKVKASSAMARWYVVACREDADPEDRVWTLSKDPSECGWETDDGYGSPYDGYGLTRADAEFLAAAANEKIERDLVRL